MSVNIKIKKKNYSVVSLHIIKYTSSATQPPKAESKYTASVSIAVNTITKDPSSINSDTNLIVPLCNPNTITSP